MWTAAEADLATALIPAVWTFLGVVVITLGTIAVQSLKSKSDRADTPPPSNGGGSSLMQVAREVARDIGQLDQRAADNDQRDQLQDRELRDQRDVLDDHHERLTVIEKHLDADHPGWRRT